MTKEINNEKSYKIGIIAFIFAIIAVSAAGEISITEFYLNGINGNVTLLPGNNVSISEDALNKTITISATGGVGGIVSDDSKVNKTGDIMSGSLDMNNSYIYNTPLIETVGIMSVIATNALRLQGGSNTVDLYTDYTVVNKYINMNGNSIINNPQITSLQNDKVNKTDYFIDRQLSNFSWMNITGLNLDYRNTAYFEILLKANGTGNVYYNLIINDDVNEFRYNNQYLIGMGSTASAGNGLNYKFFEGIAGGTSSSVVGTMTITPDGHVRFISYNSRGTATGLQLFFITVEYIIPTTTINSIKICASNNAVNCNINGFEKNSTLKMRIT